MRSYEELSQLPACAYLDPANFVTAYDNLETHKLSGKAEKQYQTGSNVGSNALYITLSVKGVWGSVTKGGGSIRAYEGIGYHACTCDLLRGFLDSQAEIDVYRYIDGRLVRYTLKRRPDGSRYCQLQFKLYRL